MSDHRKLGQEVIEDNEDALIAEITRIITDRMQATYPEGETSKRDAHPKTHGMVRSKFIVPDDLPAELQHGLFAQPGEYDALVRFSSSLQKVTPDIVMQPQGMSVKVLGVEGEKLLEAEKDATTQDFVMINHPTFFIQNLQDYRDFQQAQSDETVLEFVQKPENEGILNTLMQMLAERVFNPCQVQYWSQTPYNLGPHAIKYSAKPVDGSDPRPKAMSLSFMRDLLVEKVGNGPVAYDLLVQVQNDPDKQPIENPMIEWMEDDARPQRVARIEIPQQDISSGQDLKVAEDLSFTVWHSLPEHRPLGSMNRCRRVAYEGGSKLRHAQNDAPRAEPTQLPDF